MAYLSLLKDVTASPTIGEFKNAPYSIDTSGVRGIQAGVLGVGNVQAIVNVYGAIDIRFPKLIATFNLSGTTADINDGNVNDVTDINFPFEFYRADVTSLTAGAKVSVAIRV